MDILIFGIVLLIVGIGIIFSCKNDYSGFGYFRYLAFLGGGASILTGLLFIIGYITSIIY